jgi:hypothetical protein
MQRGRLAGLLITTPLRQTPAHAHALMLTPLALAGYTTLSVRAAQVSRAATTHHAGTRQTFAALGGDPGRWSSY